MLLEMFKAKIHLAVITESNLLYEGSLTVDEEILDAAGILPYEKVQVVNVNNGERFETYTIPSARGSKVFGLNGAAARKGMIGDRIIVITYALMEEAEAKLFKPSVIVLDDNNNIKQKL